MVLTPSYGRDYNTKAQAIQDFIDGKDFIFHDPSSPYNGKYCSIRDFQVGQAIAIRFNQYKLLTTFVIKAEHKA